jgi:hypothetical protein
MLCCFPSTERTSLWILGAASDLLVVLVGGWFLHVRGSVDSQFCGHRLLCDTHYLLGGWELRPLWSFA